MRVSRTVRVRIEHAQLFAEHTKAHGPCSLALWCQLPSGRFFETSIGFNMSGRGVAGRRQGLVAYMLRVHGLDIDRGWETGFRCLIGLHFTFRVVINMGSIAIEAGVRKW